MDEPAAVPIDPNPLYEWGDAPPAYVRGVKLLSRCGLQREIDLMSRALEAVPDGCWEWVGEIMCDSKAEALYWAVMRPEYSTRRHAAFIAWQLGEGVMKVSSGFNGIVVDGPEYARSLAMLNPCWSEAELAEAIAEDLPQEFWSIIPTQGNA